MAGDLMWNTSAPKLEILPQLSDVECFELAKSLLQAQVGWVAQRDDDDGDVSMLLSDDEPGAYVQAIFIERWYAGYRLSFDYGSGLALAGTVDEFPAVMELVRFVLEEVRHPSSDELLRWVRLADCLKNVGCKDGATRIIGLCYRVGDSILKQLN